MSFSFFEERELEYADAESCTQSRFLLNLHGFWSEMNALKNELNNDNIHFSERNRFTGYLKTILNVVLLHQEVHGVTESNTRSKPSPYSIELRLNDGKLTLYVEWFQEGAIDTYLIHKFNEESDYHAFTRKILNSNPETILNIEEYASGATIPKFLERIKMKGILADVFFISRTTNTIAALPSRVILVDSPQNSLNKLRDYIKSLNRIASYPFSIQTQKKP